MDNQPRMLLKTTSPARAACGWEPRAPDEQPSDDPDPPGQPGETSPRSRTDLNGSGRPHGYLRIRRLGVRVPPSALMFSQAGALVTRRPVRCRSHLAAFWPHRRRRRTSRPLVETVGVAIHVAWIQVQCRGDAGITQARGQMFAARYSKGLRPASEAVAPRRMRPRPQTDERLHPLPTKLRQSAPRRVRSARCARPSRASSPPPLPSRPGRRCSGSGRGTP